MKTLTLLCTFSALLALWSCKSRYTPENYAKKQLVFGSGGGFTGAVTMYTLLESGHLYRKESSDTVYVSVKRIPKAEVKTIFEEVNSLELMTYKYKQPGNMYKFIDIKADEEKNHIAWGRPQANIRKDVTAFYSKLMLLTQILE